MFIPKLYSLEYWKVRVRQVEIGALGQQSALSLCLCCFCVGRLHKRVLMGLCRPTTLTPHHSSSDRGLCLPTSNKLGLWALLLPTREILSFHVGFFSLYSRETVSGTLLDVGLLSFLSLRCCFPTQPFWGLERWLSSTGCYSTGLVRFPTPTQQFTIACNSSPGDPALSSGFCRHQTCMWCTGKTFINTNKLF